MWAKEKGITGDIAVSIRIKYGKRRAKVLRGILTKEDWKKIMTIPWNETRERVIKLFKKAKGGPLTSREIATRLNLASEDGSLIEGMNTIFRQENLPYRIMTFGKHGQFYPEKPQKLVITDRG